MDWDANSLHGTKSRTLPNGDIEIEFYEGSIGQAPQLFRKRIGTEQCYGSCYNLMLRNYASSSTCEVTR